MVAALLALALSGQSGQQTGTGSQAPAQTAQTATQTTQTATPTAQPATQAPASPGAQAQTPAATQPPVAAPDKTDKTDKKDKADKKDNADGITIGKPVQAGSVRNQRKAAKLYLQGTRLLEKEQPEQAWALLKRAAELEPENSVYIRAAALAQQSAVTQLVQQSSRENVRGDSSKAEALLQRAKKVDPTSPELIEHLDEMGDEVARTAADAPPVVAAPVEATVLGGPIQLQPSADKHSFHLKNGQRQVVQDVFHAYGIDASVHDSVLTKPIRFDLDDATFTEAMRVLGLLTQTFYEPLDPHRVLVARDTPINRTDFQRQQLETIYLPGLSDKEMTDVANLAKNVFSAQHAVISPTSGTMTIKAPTKTLAAFNQTVGQLIDGRNQLDLDIKILQLSHVSMRETGATFFQQTGVFNVFSEINSVLSQNQSLVQQIISSGLVPNQSTLANQVEILAILVASGQLTGTPFNQGFLPFGGGLTQSIVTPSPATLTLSLNTSDTRMIEDLHLRLGDQEDGTLKIGERYPIETSSYSSLAVTALAGTSGANQTVPQIQYEDLGLTLKATAPKIMRSGDVAISLDLKIESLGGASLNDIPILNSQQVAGVLTLRAGETAVLLSDLSRQESRALSGTPGLGDIPGLEDLSDIQRNENVARLLILITPAVVRGDSQQFSHGPMLMVDKAATGTATSRP
ncbi:hypothetical protein [Acidicapsa ligni]|uniref:hypothetical protein n=1 Tax=Acidicapsa ligni TaxID=542300 RepID=UPI0021DF4E21|nr:hypothetical protein [Acidicapsa ligni]